MIMTQAYTRGDVIERLDRLEKRLEKVESVLSGNNGEGLRTEFAVLRERLSNVSSQINDVSCKMDYLKTRLAELEREAETHVDFRWVMEKILLPWLLPLVSTAIALYSLSRVAGYVP